MSKMIQNFFNLLKNKFAIKKIKELTFPYKKSLFPHVIPNEVSNSNIILTIQCNQPSIAAKTIKVIKWFVIVK